MTDEEYNKLTYSQKRRYDCMSPYQRKEFEKQQEIQDVEMTRAEERENQSRPYETIEAAKRGIGTSQGKFISACLQAYIEGDEIKFNRYSDRTKRLVQKMYDDAINGSSAHTDQVLNRAEGKVRDEIHVDYTIAKHIPDQDKQADILQRYRQQTERENIIQ